MFLWDKVSKKTEDQKKKTEDQKDFFPASKIKTRRVRKEGRKEGEGRGRKEGEGRTFGFWLSAFWQHVQGLSFYCQTGHNRASVRKDGLTSFMPNALGSTCFPACPSQIWKPRCHLSLLVFSFICNRKRQPGKIRRGRLFAGDFCGENFSFGSTVAIQHETLAIVIASLVFLSVFFLLLQLWQFSMKL